MNDKRMVLISACFCLSILFFLLSFNFALLLFPYLFIYLSIYSQVKGMLWRISLQMENADTNNVELAKADSFQIFTHSRSKSISF
jgi:hypothetical protein